MSISLKGIYIYFEISYFLPTVCSKMHMQRFLLHSKE